MYTLININEHQCWYLTFAVVFIFYLYVVHDLNCLGAYTSQTVDEQDSVVARHNRTN